MLITLDKSFSRPHIEMLFSFFSRKEVLIFHAVGDKLHEISDPIFLGKISCIISLSSAELTQRVVKVKRSQNSQYKAVSLFEITVHIVLNCLKLSLHTLQK